MTPADVKVLIEKVPVGLIERGLTIKFVILNV